MITRYRPPSSVEPITEGLNGRATDTTTGRVVDGVCRQGHGGVLMGRKGNGEVVEDRP